MHFYRLKKYLIFVLLTHPNNVHSTECTFEHNGHCTIQG